MIEEKTINDLYTEDTENVDENTEPSTEDEFDQLFQQLLGLARLCIMVIPKKKPSLLRQQFWSKLYAIRNYAIYVIRQSQNFLSEEEKQLYGI